MDTAIRFRTVLATILLLCISLGMVATATSEPPAARAPEVAATPVVRMTFDYNDGVQKSFMKIPYSKGMTVIDALNIAKAHPRGVSFTSTGSGGTTFITQIDDLKNQGGGKDAKNWQYSINGSVGTRGVGVAVLEPGDILLWEFDVYKPSSPAK